MTSVITLNALHPTLAFRVGEEHRDHVEDGTPTERDEDRAIERMNEEDADYIEEMEEAESHDDQLRKSAEYALHRTQSPDLYDVDDHNPITPAQPLSKSMNRTVTINEPTRDSLDKANPSSNPDVPQLQSYTTPLGTSNRRRSYWPSRTFSLSRSNTFTTYDTFTSFLSTSWSNRHDPSHTGFWSGTWNFLIGKKLNPDGTEQTGPSESDPDYIPPKYRWTPILSGLLQPFSILLEIPGLTEHWYVRTIDNVPVAYQANPVLLDVGLAISMACAVVANIALISRFLERRVFPSTMITIIGLSIHDLINIIAVTIFGVVHRFDDGFTYSEAFWLCVCSTVASMTTNATLIYDLIHTKDFKRSGSGLTAKQRSLVIIVMVLLVYIALGSLCFNFLLPLIPFQNCLYYTVVSIETIGFGDISPSTLGAKIFLFFYIPLGILNLAVTVGTARDTIVESWNAAYRRRRHNMLARHKIRKKQRIEEGIRRAAIERQLAAIGAPAYVNTRGGGVRGGSKGRKLNIRALTGDQLEKAESEAMVEIGSLETSLTKTEVNGDEGVERSEAEKALRDVKRLQEELAQQSLQSEEGYREFQEKMVKEEKMENLIKFAFAFTLFIFFWIIGATIFTKTEKWSWFTAFYFCFVAFTTIGYGDVYPQTPAGRAFFIIWALFGVATVTLLIAVLTEAYSNRYKSALIHKGTKRAMSVVKSHRERLIRDHHRRRTEMDEDEEGISKERYEKLPLEIIELVKSWHTYVDVARASVIDGDKTDGMNALVDKMIDEQDLPEVERKALKQDVESRKILFWNGYEKAVHDLVGVAESAIRHHESSARAHRALTQLSEAPSTLRRTNTTLSNINEAWRSQPDLGSDVEKAARRVETGNGLYKSSST